jgi:hypothetical protein
MTFKINYMKICGLSLDATNHYNQWVRIDALNGLESSAAAVGLRSVFAARVRLMKSDLALVAKVSGRANYDLGGITDDKVDAKRVCGDEYGVITGNARSFAMDYGLTKLVKQMKDSTANMLYKAKDANCVAMCKGLDTLLRALIVKYPVVAKEYFTVAQLDSAGLKAKVFAKKMGIFNVAFEDVSNAKKEFKTKWMPKMKGHVEFLKGMLGGAITKEFPKYAGTFLGLIKLNKKGKRRQGLFVTMVDAITGKRFTLIARFEPLNYPVIAVPKLGKSNGSGDFAFMKLKAGLWRMKFFVPGYEDQIIIVKIGRKEVVKMKVRMVSVN